MQSWLKISALAGILALILLISLIQVPLVDYRTTTYTANSGELTGSVSTGQTFKATQDNLSAVAVMFATYSGRDNQQDVYFTLREFERPLEILRQAQVNAATLGDNQLHRFSFNPLKDSAGKTYIFLVTSPASTSGDAVTVDVNKHDPYHFGSAYLLKSTSPGQAQGPDGNITLARLSASGKADLDLTFNTYYHVPLWQAGVAKLKDSYAYLKESWREKRSLYGLWSGVAVQAMLMLGISWWAAIGLSEQEDSSQSTRRKIIGWLFILTILAIITRLVYAVELPLTNDEGNYLYDARTLLQGHLAGGDGYVKAPLVILWIALGQLIGGQTIIAGRLSAVLISALTLWPIYSIAQQLWGKSAGLAAATAWALLGVTTVFGIYVHTQPLAIFWGTSGLAVLLLGLRTYRRGQTEWADNILRRGFWLLFTAGLLLGLGVISRKSILALGLAVLLTLLLKSCPWPAKLTNLLTVGLGFALVITLFLGFAWLVYGSPGVWEATGFNSAKDGITAVDQAQLAQVRAYSIRGMTPFFRESMPLIMLSLLGLGFAGELILATLPLNRGKRVVKKLAWLVPLLAFGWAWSFFSAYEGTAAMYGGMRWLWWAMLVVMLVLVIWPEQTVAVKTTRQSTPPAPSHAITAWLIPILWLGGLVFFYLNWIKFHANYIGEFLPPLVILSGLAFPQVVKRLAVPGNKRIKFPSVLFMFIFVAVLYWALFVSGFITYTHEHTGTFQQKALQEAAVWARANIPLKEPIFTGAAAVPYLSGHHTALDIAHPRWYAYEFTRQNPRRLNTFLPSVEQMRAAYRKANWFLLEKQTGFSFLREYADIEAGLEQDWTRVQGIANGSNTLTFYKRK